MKGFKSLNEVHRPLNRRRSFWLVILIVVILIDIWIRIDGFFFKHSTVKPIPVVLDVARTHDVPVYLPELGNVIPTYTVTVKTQINGQLLRVLFREGQMVKQGELLAQIDPRPYQAQLVQYEGQLARDQALLANARLDLLRYQKLWSQDSVSKQTLDTQVALVKQYEGTVTLDQGLIDATKVNLIYCDITSPIDGRVGLRLVDPGNFVQVSDTTGIVIINTLNPITVIFSIPEDSVPQVMQQINAGKSLKVEAYDRTQNKLLATGTLLTIDNQIDPTTGTVKLRAQFQNENNTLFPDQFVNIKLLVDILQNATIVSTAGIQHGPQGTYVYLLNTNQTVSVKPVVTGVTSGDDTVIMAGVLPGQSVVVEGADKLTEGAPVIVSNTSHLTSLAQALAFQNNTLA